jgi:hypothetical protein
LARKSRGKKKKAKEILPNRIRKREKINKPLIFGQRMMEKKRKK